MLTEFLGSNRPLSPQEIRDFEKRWKVELPDSYRMFLLKNNGGRPVPATFPIEGMENNPFGTIQQFFGLNTSVPTEDLNWILGNLGVPRPEGLLPIACTSGSDFVCINTHSGSVFFWDRMASWGKRRSNAKDFFPIANSFDDLIAKLHERVSESETEAQRVIRTDDFDALVRLLDSGYPLESVDEQGRTLIENAAIAGRPAMIYLLFDRGAKLGNALQLAEQNFDFFPEHRATVDVLRGIERNLRKQGSS
jgi:hypothetical protein